MEIVKAQAGDLDVIKEITQTTIKAIYPKYYPAGAVDFFLAHHSDEHILSDISEENVYILEAECTAVGTVTVSNGNIYRLFVLPEYQHKGYGKALLNFVCLRYYSESDTRRPYAFIGNVVTREDYRGRGYAGECLDFAKQIAEKENCYKMMLMTGSKKSETLRFYEKAGYNSSDKTAFIQWIGMEK